MLFDKLKREKRHTYEVPKRDPGLDQPLSPTLEDTLARLAQLTGQTADLQVNRLEVEGYKLAFVMFEGLVNYQTLILGTASDLHRLLAGQKTRPAWCLTGCVRSCSWQGTRKSSGALRS